MGNDDNGEEDELREVAYLKVKKEKGEAYRQTLADRDLLEFRAPILSEGNCILLPLAKEYEEGGIGDMPEVPRRMGGEPIGNTDGGGTMAVHRRNAGDGVEEPTGNAEERETIRERRSIAGDSEVGGGGSKLTSRIVRLKKREPTDYRELLNVPPRLWEHLPASWDIIGDLLLVKLDEEVTPYKEEIGKAIVDTYKNVRSVYLAKEVTGRRRTRDVELIAGKGRTETVTKEFGVRMRVNIRKVYYSPRLATERWRIVQKVGEGEKILDMFAGVGPFSLLIARRTDAEVIHAIDINPAAVELLGKNIEMNKIHNVIAHEGDAREVCGDLRNEIRFHRIIMNLPHTSPEYLPDALSCARVGGTIHLYLIGPGDGMDGEVGKCVERAGDIGYELEEIGRRKIKSYSATRINICSDLRVKRIAPGASEGGCG